LKTSPRSKGNLLVAVAEKEEGEKTVNIEIREKSAEVKKLNSELRKSRVETEKQELQARIILLEAFVTDLKKKYQLSKEKLKECHAMHAEWRKKSV